MNKREKRAGRTVVELDPPIRKALEEYCKEHGHTLTWLINKLVKEYLEQEVQNHDYCS